MKIFKILPVTQEVASSNLVRIALKPKHLQVFGLFCFLNKYLRYSPVTVNIMAPVLGEQIIEVEIYVNKIIAA